MNKITVKDDQIIITELRPMSEAPDLSGKLIAYGLIYFNYSDLPDYAYYSPYGCDVSLSGAVGWITMPVYKPNVAPSCQDAVNIGLKV